MSRLRILTLDGSGGVRGLSSLLILRDIMQRLKMRGAQSTRPCECFDLIVGTGTGAISALFLGRLGMTVDDAITEYVQVTEKVFKPSHKGVPRPFLGTEAPLDGRILERELESIALKILHEPGIVQKFGQHRYFISCEGILSVSHLIDSLCTIFGIPRDSADPQDFDGLYESTNQRASLLLFLRNRYTSLPALLLLDNFETLWDDGGVQTGIEDFLKDLGDVKVLALLVTMRGTEYPGGLRWSSPRLEPVPPLDPAASRAVFSEICGLRSVEGDDLDNLLQEMDHLALAVTLMAPLAQNETIPTLSKRWKEERTKLLSRTKHKSRHQNVDISVQVSLHSHRLSSTTGALLLLSAIAMLPLGVFEDDIAALFPRIPNLSEVSLTLREVSLTYRDPSSTAFRILSPIRFYILQNHPPNPEHIEGVESFHFALARHARDSSQTRRDSMGYVAQHGLNIEAITVQALSRGKDGGAVQAALDWTRFLRHSHRPRTTVIQAAVDFVRKNEEKHKLAECLYSLGDTHRQLHEYKAAEAALIQARDEYQALDNSEGASEYLWSLVQVWSKREKYTQAEDALVRSLDRYKSLQDFRRTAQCLLSLGNFWRRRKQFVKAEEALAEARTQFTSLRDPRAVARCLSSLAEVWSTREKHVEAENALVQAGGLYKSCGDLGGAADCLLSLGNLRRKRELHDEAAKAFSQALESYRSLGASYGMARCQWYLGKIDHHQTKYQTASDKFAQAQKLFERNGRGLDAARCLLSLGYISKDQKKFEEAKQFFEDAKARFEKLGPSGQQERDLCANAVSVLDIIQLNKVCDMATRSNLSENVCKVSSTASNENQA